MYINIHVFRIILYWLQTFEWWVFYLSNKRETSEQKKYSSVLLHDHFLIAFLFFSVSLTYFPWFISLQ